MPEYQTQKPVVVERRVSFIRLLVALILAAAVVFGIWLAFIADDETADEIIPDGVDVTVEVVN